MDLEPGVKAPDFVLPDENGIERKLSDYNGKPLILYFYPKDDTPGCTKEACGFRDDYSQYESVDVEIIGVSPDSPEKHTKFKKKYNLPFTLLADENHEIAEKYRVWGLKKSAGREYYGIKRTTYLIDKNGIIYHIFKNVKPAEHSSEILDVLNKMD
ncbi:MAG: thioredoxin-dependent thiol peroxidase [Anaerolineales bacterium]|jgi:peroxiredoxin Q/BCP